MTDRRVFLRFFALLLALCAGAALAAYDGVFALVWANDASRMTSAIGALLVVALARLGVAAWRGDAKAAAFGHLAERLAPMLGIAGTAIGLSMQAQALAGAGTASFGALATSLYTTASGVVAAMVIAVATHMLEAARR